MLQTEFQAAEPSNFGQEEILYFTFEPKTLVQGLFDPGFIILTNFWYRTSRQYKVPNFKLSRRRLNNILLCILWFKLRTLLGKAILDSEATI